jgi:hypothetical protein
MKVFIQQISTGLFLKTAREWVEPVLDARVFRSSVSAVTFCVQHLTPMARDLRLMARSENPENDLYFYPFGRDPQRENLQKSLVENRKLRETSRELLRRIDSLAAETKERKKQIPFKPKGMAQEKDNRNSAA